MGLSGLSFSFPALISAEYISLKVVREEEGRRAVGEMLYFLRTVKNVGGEVEFFSTRPEESPVSEDEVDRLIDELNSLEEEAWLSVVSGRRLLVFADVGIRIRVSLSQLLRLMEIAREISSQIDRLGRYRGE
ncbi:MAG: hypothetical protein DRO06_03555, partial [Thermoproteota archaeon]